LIFYNLQNIGKETLLKSMLTHAKIFKSMGDIYASQGNLAEALSLYTLCKQLKNNTENHLMWLLCNFKSGMSTGKKDACPWH